MDAEKAATALEPLSSERMQDKADILENNLFNSIVKQNNKIKILFQINRTQYPDPVIVQSLLQLFPRINIKGPEILANLKKLLTRVIPENGELKIKKKLKDLSGSDNQDLTRLSLSMEILLTRKLLSMVFKGTPEIPSLDGAIGKSYFDHEACPGLLMENGVIDFREINKYPVVSAGDNLFFITPEYQGKPGLGFDGEIIPVPRALPLDINLKGGIDLVDSLGYRGKTRGHFLRASRTGVVLLTKSSNQLTGIEISNNLDINRLDYSTGNIGTEHICPISMKVGIVCSEFKLREKGIIEINTLEGGEVTTDCHAVIQTIQPNSKVSAREDITFHMASNSILISENGCITIKEQLIESSLFSAGISFEKQRGILTSNILDAEIISLKNIYFCGENKIYFGRRLFSQKKALKEALKNLQKKTLSEEDKTKKLMGKLQNELQKLTKAIKTNPLIQNNLKQFILATRTMAFEVLYKELEAIAKQMNTKEVTNIKKLLDILSQKPQQNKSRTEDEENINKKIREIDRKMSQMTLTIHGYLRRASTLKIFTGAEKEDVPQKPELFIESEKDQDTLIKIQGRFNKWEGFTVTHN